MKGGKISLKNDISKRKKIDYGVWVDLYIYHNGRKLISTSTIHKKFVCGYELEATLSKWNVGITVFIKTK